MERLTLYRANHLVALKAEAPVIVISSAARKYRHCATKSGSIRVLTFVRMQEHEANPFMVY